MMLKVLVVGQTPPPFGGQAIMIEKFVKSELADVKLILVRMGFSSHMNEVGRVSLTKIAHMFGIIVRIIFYRVVHGVRIMYYPPSGADRVPVCRDAMILIATRWLFDKTIFHFHSGGISELYPKLPRWQQWLFRQAFFGADAAVRLSELNPEDGRRLEAKCDYVIPNGIDDPLPGLVVAERSDEATGDPLRILFVGILRESKGVLVLVEACGKLAERGVPFHLELMGQWHSDEFAERVQRRIAELELGNRIRFLGLVTGEQKFDAYRRADVFCFPTFFNCETFGVVLVEAMACGLPAVSTRWRAIPSIVDDGQTGFLVDPHDPDGVADRLELLANDPELRLQMGREGRRKFELQYTFPQFASRMRRMLLETAGLLPKHDFDPTPTARINRQRPELETSAACK